MLAVALFVAILATAYSQSKQQPYIWPLPAQYTFDETQIFNLYNNNLFESLSSIQTIFFSNVCK